MGCLRGVRRECQGLVRIGRGTRDGNERETGGWVGRIGSRGEVGAVAREVQTGAANALVCMQVRL